MYDCQVLLKFVSCLKHAFTVPNTLFKVCSSLCETEQDIQAAGISKSLWETFLVWLWNKKPGAAAEGIALFAHCLEDKECQ